MTAHFYARRFKAVVFFASLLVGILFAQQLTQAQTTEPITTFPYQSSFGTSMSPGADNALWKTCAIKVENGQQAQTESDQWKFSQAPGGDALAAAFEGSGQVEMYPTLRSPMFSLRREEGADYVFTMKIHVPEGGRLPSSNHLVFRVNKLDDDGAMLPLTDLDMRKGFLAATMKDPVTKDGVAQSLYVGAIEEGGPQEGTSIYEFRLSAGDLSLNGNYCLAITESGTTSVAATCKFYITEFKAEKVTASDVEACQLLSPVSVIREGTPQQVQAYMRNVGAAPATAIEAFYQVDNGRVVSQVLAETLAPAETRLLTFNVPVTLTAGVHRIKYWLKDADDMNPKNDTSLTYVVKVSDIYPASFSNFDFSKEEQTYGWHAYSDTVEMNPLWHFAAQAPFRPQAATQGEVANAAHDDYLVSPWFDFKKGQVYQIDITLETVLGSAEILGEKSFSVWLSTSNRKEDIANTKRLLWDAGVLRRKGERTMTFFFEADADTAACVIFRSNGPASDGFIRINHFGLQQPSINEMNLAYDFEPYFSSDPISQAKEYMTFVDQDWNALVEEVVGDDGFTTTREVEPVTTSGWEVVQGSLGYSAYVKGIQGQANDWLVFYPMELKAGKKYYFHFQAWKQGTGVHEDNGKCALEMYLQDTYPRYDLPYAEQEGWKSRVDVTGVSAATHSYADITVPEDGYYFLSIRNVSYNENEVSHPTVYDNSVYLDNVMFADQNFSSVQALEAQIPYEARLGQTVSMTLAVKNFSQSVISRNNILYCYRIEGHEAVKQTYTSDLASMAHITYEFKNVDFSKEDGDRTVYFWVETSGSTDIPDTVAVEVKRIYPKELPYEDEFTASSTDEWQFYPSSLNAWVLSTESSAVYSGTHCMSYRPGSNANINYLVSPVLKVQKDTVYRVAFRYKREHASDKTDSIRLYYSYNQFDRYGFVPMGKSFVADSAGYVLCESYVKFPTDGGVYMALGVDCALGSSVLFIDDFSLADSSFAHGTQMILSGLQMPQGMSFCDTASKGAVEFYVKNSSFLDVENVKLRYEDVFGGGQKELALGAVARHDSIKVSVPMGHRPEGEYAFKVWNVMPYERDRRDDTLAGVFRVSGPKGFPFSEDFEGVVEGTGAVDVNDDDMVWRILTSEQQAHTGMQCLSFPHKNALSGAVFFTDGFLADETGRFKITFYMKADVEGNDGVGVRVMEYSADGAFASSVYIDTLRAGTEYQACHVPFHVESGKVYAIAFEYVADRASTEEGQAFFIDDLTTGTITVPLTPRSLAVSDTGVTSASFVCQNMAERNVLHVFSVDGSFSRLYEWKSTQQKFEVEGLQPKTEYRAQVCGLNEVNDSSAWSAQVRFTTLAPALSVNDGVQADSRVKVWPNPATDHIQVEFPLWADRWSLRRADGREVMRGEVLGSSYEIGLQSLSAGMYILRVEGKDRSSVTKIIKR